jgi:hypothetical protein
MAMLVDVKARMSRPTNPFMVPTSRKFDGADKAGLLMNTSKRAKIGRKYKLYER